MCRLTDSKLAEDLYFLFLLILAPVLVLLFLVGAFWMIVYLTEHWPQ